MVCAAGQNGKREEIMDYRNAGVDIEAGYKSVELMKQYVKTTARPEMLGGLGGFSGANISSSVLSLILRSSFQSFFPD